MSTLAPLHRQLAALRSERRWARWLMAYSGLGLGILATLAGLFLLDWTFRFSVAERVVLGLAGLAVVGFVFRQVARPWLFQRETELDLALLVERAQQLDSDLIAALEFERPQARTWGSSQLAGAVVDYVADFSADLDVRRGLPVPPVRPRLVALGCAVAAVLIAGALFPGHLAAFANRLLLGASHYPTRTQIERLLVRGEPIDLELRSVPLMCPYGEPLEFEIHTRGEVPRFAEIALRNERGESPAVLDLQSVGAEPGVFRGRLSRLVEDLSFTLRAGDAWTDPRLIRAIPLPVVTVDLSATPPEYAQSGEPLEENEIGARQISVLEGADVSLLVVGRNKPLERVELKIGENLYPLEPDAERRRWLLPLAGSPLVGVQEPIRYSLEVVDVDGLRPGESLDGFIRLRTDRAPRVAAAVVTHHVLPSGRPNLRYTALDDYGLASLRVNCQVAHEDGTMAEHVWEIPLPGERPTSLQARFPLELSRLGLTKGDQLKLTLEAEDYRGRSPGKLGSSEPLVLHVTDERGVLAAMAESDQRSAKQIDAIIQRQLGMGDEP